MGNCRSKKEEKTIINQSMYITPPPFLYILSLSLLCCRRCCCFYKLGYRIDCCALISSVQRMGPLRIGNRMTYGAIFSIDCRISLSLSIDCPLTPHGNTSLLLSGSIFFVHSKLWSHSSACWANVTTMKTTITKTK